MKLNASSGSGIISSPGYPIYYPVSRTSQTVVFETHQEVRRRMCTTSPTYLLAIPFPTLSLNPSLRFSFCFLFVCLFVFSIENNDAVIFYGIQHQRP